MFFDKQPLKRNVILKELPPIPDTGWRPPQYFPNLANACTIGFDVETKETDFQHGPGWARNEGHIVGFSVAARDPWGNAGSWYFPIRHECEPEYNLDPRTCFQWLKSVLETPRVKKKCANGIYDIGWLTTENIYVTGELDDVQFAEALIDEEARVALDVLGKKYLGIGKDKDAVFDWCQAAYPGTPADKWRGDLYRAPPRLVGFYGEQDADLPIRVSEMQAPVLASQGLTDLHRMECDLIPLYVRMRLEGCTVDAQKSVEIKHELELETAQLYNNIEHDYGYRIEKSDSGNVGRLLQHIGIDTPLTKKGKASVTKDWLAGLTHPVAQVVSDIREREKVCGTFLQKYIIDRAIDGKIFPQFHPLKGDEKGTKVGRFSSSDPNLQNIPTRTKIGKRVREAFIKDYGHFCWQKNDYSQIHYRILAHFAVDKGDGSADALRARYINDPKTDYHKDVYNNVVPLMGWDASDEEHAEYVRRPIKNVNFGLLYGQSLKSLMVKVKEYFGTDFTEEMAKAFFDAYFLAAPYVKPTMNMIGEEVQKYGYVTTVLGRRCRFNQWEPNVWGGDDTPCSFAQAVRQWGMHIRRAYEYRGVNYKFQGSEPDIMKRGMWLCLRSGVYDQTGVPRLTVHDEKDFSVRDDSKATREAFAYINHTMENSVKLRVPIFVDEERGVDWGNVMSMAKWEAKLAA